MKITIVYESMFGNTHEVAQAIGDGVRKAHPDADVECVAVGNASAELIKTTDLLVVGGPTHIRHMTTGFSRKMGISGEEKAEAKGEPAHELETDAEGPGLREWFDHLPKAERETRPPLSTLASAPRWPAAQLTGLPTGCTSTAITWSRTPKASSWTKHMGRFAPARSSGRRSGELS